MPVKCSKNHKLLPHWSVFGMLVKPGRNLVVSIGLLQPSRSRCPQEQSPSLKSPVQAELSQDWVAFQACADVAELVYAHV